MTNIRIRPAQASDIDVITAIYRPAVLHGTASFEVDPPDVAEMTRRMSALLGGGFPYLVAERDGRVIGYAYAGAYRPRPAYRNTVEDSIYIAPDVQNTGVGRMLLEALIKVATERGFRQMIGVIGDSNSLGSINLHRACGFQHAGTIRSAGYKHGRWLDQVLMQRALGPGDTTLPA